jgi:hypothetical protein
VFQVVRCLAKPYVSVLADLDPIPPRIVEVELLLARDVDPFARKRGSDGVEVVDDDPEVTVGIPAVVTTLEQSEHLVAEIDPRLLAFVLAKLDREDASVEVDRLLHVSDFDGDVVDSDQARATLHQRELRRPR